MDPLLRASIEEINKIDPEGFFADSTEISDAPWDEYEPEAKDFLLHMRQHGPIDIAALDVIWNKWFGSPGEPVTVTKLVGEGRAEELVDRLNKVWEEAHK